MVEIVKAAEYGKLISGRTRIRTSYPSKEASFFLDNGRKASGLYAQGRTQPIITGFA
jgi:hypothetical protein